MQTINNAYVVIHENIGRYHITHVSDIEKMNENIREIEK